MEPVVQKLINREYGLNIRSEVDLGGKSTRIISDQGDFVVKYITASEESEQLTSRHVAAYDFLSKHNIPALSLYPTLNGQQFVQASDKIVFLYRYLLGKHPSFDTQFFRELGVLLGKLHSIPAKTYMYPSEYHPYSHIPKLKQRLQCLRQPYESQSIRNSLDILESLQREVAWEQLPQSFIHGDPYYFNLVRDEHGVLHFIDLDLAGVAPAIIDIGFVIAQMCFMSPKLSKSIYWQVPGSGSTWETRRSGQCGHAFLQAYQSIRPLTYLERLYLPEATKLATIRHIDSPHQQTLNIEYFTRVQKTADFLKRIVPISELATAN